MADQRFARLHLLIGDEGIERMKASTVMVVGLGGVGGSCVDTLARGGIGTLILIDGDTVDITNINRQAVAYSTTIGKDKTEVAKEIVSEINPSCQVYSKKVFLAPDTMDVTLASFPRPDYVIDCIDSIASKLALAEWCMDQKIPLLASMGAGNKLDPSRFKFAPIEKTTHCGLSKIIRLECRKRGIEKLEVLFSDEPGVKIDSHGSKEKATTLGTMSYMPPILGKLLASKVIRRLLGYERYKLTPIRRKQKVEANDTLD